MGSEGKKLLSMKQYSVHRGITHRAVAKAIEEGRITAEKNVHGHYAIDPSRADAEWAANTGQGVEDDAVAAPDMEAEEFLDPTETAKADDDASMPGKEPKNPTYAQSRAKREAFNAKNAELVYLERSGKLVDAEKVRSQAFRSARIVRDAIMNIPNRLAAELAAETDPSRCHAHLTAALNEALEELSRVIGENEVDYQL